MKFTLIFIFCQNKVLLIKRLFEPIKDQITGVGGHIEKNESASQCAHRELLEEAGFDCELKDVGYMPSIRSEIFIGKIAMMPFNNKVMEEGNLQWYSPDELKRSSKLTKQAKLIIQNYGGDVWKCIGN